MSGEDDIRAAITNAENVIDAVVAQEPASSGTKANLPAPRRSQAADMVELVHAHAEVFHAPDGVGYVDLHVDGHRETLAIRSKQFSQWLAGQVFMATRGAPGSEALSSALNVIEAMAKFQGAEHEVFVRVGVHDGRTYLDLADPTWRAVEISASGWKIVDNPPVRFRRPAGLRPLATPVTGGAVHQLRDFLNVGSDNDFVLAVSWLLAALNGHGPYPVMVVTGEQGSAKSTCTRILRSLVDPNSAPLRAFSSNERDLFITAGNSHVLGYDNMSTLPAHSSDVLCRIATGGGFATRRLHTDQDEVLFDVTRPIILNGIGDVATRSDLADRAIFLRLEAISDENRRPEADLWTAFEAAAPGILGALLDALVAGLERLPTLRMEKMPRMADFARLATACEEPLWPAGTFAAAYEGNRQEAVDNVIDANPLAEAVRDFAGRGDWAGTASQLLAELNAARGTNGGLPLPSTASALSTSLRRIAPVLRRRGIAITHKREGHAGVRMIFISVPPTDASSDHLLEPASAPSVPSACARPCGVPPVPPYGKRTITDNTDTHTDSPMTPDRRIFSEPVQADSADSADSEFNIDFEAAKEWTFEWLERL